MFGRDIDPFFEEVMYQDTPEPESYECCLTNKYITYVDGERVVYSMRDGVWIQEDIVNE